jgi:hypothetical protein
MIGRYPELLHQAAEAAGVTVEEVHDAIRAVLELLPTLQNSSTDSHLILPFPLIKSIDTVQAIYDQWLKPIAQPLADSTGLEIEKVYRALVGAVQWTKD